MAALPERQPIHPPPSESHVRQPRDLRGIERPFVNPKIPHPALKIARRNIRPARSAADDELAIRSRKRPRPALADARPIHPEFLPPASVLKNQMRPTAAARYWR